MVRLFLVGDFRGSFSEGLKNKLSKESFDAVLCNGDLADLKEIRDFFLKYGWNYLKIKENELDSIRERGVEASVYPLSELNSLGKPVYLVLGNGEFIKKSRFKEIASNFENLNLIDLKTAELNGIQIKGYPYHFCEERIEDKANIDNLVEEFRSKCGKDVDNKTIVLSHYPPYNCKFDKLPESNPLTPGKRVGSKVLEQIMVERYIPLIVCGHLENYQGQCFKGGTRIINPGSAELEKYAILDTVDLGEVSVSFRE